MQSVNKMTNMPNLKFRLLTLILAILFMPTLALFAKSPYKSLPEKNWESKIISNSFIHNPVTESNLSQLVLDNIRKGTIEKANEMLNEKPVTVTAASSIRSTGGLHDFYSEGDYWWPDSLNPEGPYIRKDGQTNPEIFSNHRFAMIRFSEITSTLT